ncbi:MAG: hypothetical protein ACYC7D_02245 [Nitrososphaerales archaeon]
MSRVKQDSIPNFNSKERACVTCDKTMFYSQENLVHVCLTEDHGILCYFEPDDCWFAAKEATAKELEKRGLKFHFIPKNVFESAGLKEFTCDYDAEAKTVANHS